MLHSLIPALQNIKRQIIKSENLQKITSNFSWLLFDKVLRMGVGLFVGVWVARYLGPNDYGALNYAIAFSSLFSAVSIFGLDSIAVRDLVKNTDAKDKILGTVFWVKLVTGSIAFVFCCLTVLLFKNDFLTIFLVIIIAFSSIVQIGDVFDYYFQSLLKSKLTVIARNIAFVISSLIKVLLIILHSDIIYFALMIVLELILSSSFLYMIYLRNFEKFRPKFDGQICRQLLKDGAPLAFASIMITIYMRIDQIMIGEILNEKSVGHYSAAVRVAELGYFLPMIITSSLLPSIIQSKKVSEEAYFIRLKLMYSILFWISFSVAVVTSLFSEKIIGILFGLDYYPSSKALSISAWSGIFVYLGVGTSQFLLAENLTGLSFWRTLLSVVLNMILNFVWIPVYGINGAAYASFVSYIATIVFLIFFGETRRQISLILSALNPFIIKKIYKLKFPKEL